jgi:hypothetical protein
MGEIDKINELPEADELPPANEDSAEYKEGFQAGKEGKPSDGKTIDWHRGWADAQEQAYSDLQGRTISRVMTEPI